MKIIGFAGSNHSHSINQELIKYVLRLTRDKGHQTKLLDINDYEVPIFSIQRNQLNGIDPKIKEFASEISHADLVIISLAEYNGSYTSAFKNLYDWISVIPNRSVFDSKDVIVLSTSPGARGGKSVLASAIDRFPRDGAKNLKSFSLPEFDKNFDTKLNQITNKTFDSELKQILDTI